MVDHDNIKLSGKKDSNLRLSAWQADALPLSYSRMLSRPGPNMPSKTEGPFLRSTLSGKPGSNWRLSAWKADALPTELLPQNFVAGEGFEPPTPRL
jgi:hypothetical protein